MKPTFDNTVDILVKAYLNDTLEHGNCSACAVGNLITASGYVFDSASHTGPHGKFQWLAFIYAEQGKLYYTKYLNTRTAAEQIDATGYTWQQLARIEYAFEAVEPGHCEDECMFRGLMAVVDVLAEIHNIDLEQKAQAKALFVK